MVTNVGTTDRVFRIVGGLALLSLVFILDGHTRWLGLIGLGPLLTALVGWCPGYVPFGISTCKSDRAPST